MEKFLDALADTLKAMQDRLFARMEAIEQRQAIPGRDGRDGKDGKDGKDGASVALTDVVPLIESQVSAHVSKAIDALPKPKDGEPGPVGPQGERGSDGTSVSVDELRGLVADAVTKHFSHVSSFEKDFQSLLSLSDEAKEFITAAVAEAVAAIPKPKDGERGADGPPGPVGPVGPAGPAGEIGPKGDTGEKGSDGAVGPAGPEGPMGPQGPAGEAGPKGDMGEKGADGKDGLGIASAIVDRSGHLILSYTDGSTKDVGEVVGKDGAPGAPGINGKDGLGFDDLDVEYDSEREFRFVFRRGDVSKAFPFRVPALIYRDVYKDGTAYEAGDVVTWAGSMWVAKADTNEKPGSGATAWKLCVKAGREGRPGPQGMKGERGERGEKGDRGPDRW